MPPIVWTVVIGGIVGWLASVLMGSRAQMGLLANIAVGIVGSALGFWLAGALQLRVGGALGGWVVSVGGAALLIAILRALKVLR